MSDTAYDKSLDRQVPLGPNGEPVVLVGETYATDLEPVAPVQNPEFDPPVLVYLAADGILEVVTEAGTTRTYPAGTFAAQSVVPLKVTQIRAATTATVYAVHLE